MTRGEMDNSAREIIFLFIRRVHQMTGLPLQAIFQGRVYGSGDNDEHSFPDITIKFDATEVLSLERSPDMEFASKFVTRMTIRDISDVALTPPFKELEEGDTIIVNASKKWSFLEQMGYIRIVGIPGEKIELVGSDARDAYLYSHEPLLREVEVLSRLSSSQLVSVGIMKDAGSEVFEGRDESGSRHVDWNTRSWRYRKYVDLDDPRAPTLYGKTRDWAVNDLPRERSSLSPEPQDVSLYY